MKETVTARVYETYETLVRIGKSKGTLTQEYIDEIAQFYREKIEMEEEEIQVYVQIMTMVLHEPVAQKEQNESK